MNDGADLTSPRHGSEVVPVDPYGRPGFPFLQREPGRRELILLGTSGSVGVPSIGCDSPACRSDDPRDARTRCGVLVPAPQGNIVIDTPPELRLQLVRERVPMVHAGLFTHGHADHVTGLDDLRICSFRLDEPLPLHCEPSVGEQLQTMFGYAFREPPAEAHSFAVPRFSLHELIPGQAVDVLGLSVLPVRLNHGRLPILGFRFGSFAYCTDVSEIPEESFRLLRGVRTLVIDALRDRPHSTHFSVGEAVEAAKRIGAERTWLTHISTELVHADVEARLPPHVRPAYDGLRLPF
ncbi:MBL fold metallo-hydrolase [Alienimonas californiensis]|uniref:Phosphoribosyl 1,2-cyclic phosphodiesterase n=1 Tax=Alienimonas californiensis TaxID=2527989 RepID=A0A517PD14_9PLAN|nr:MBL fold metallo-hydrolase [Alienimonas californiensis]QDT17273.1 Phosphoribosyl 1,2-cyclic phosphodiesterase [Alienimonas californiensis]